MANVNDIRISGLPAHSGALPETSVLPVSVGTETRKITAADLVAFFEGNLYGGRPARAVFIGPTSGTGAPTWRTLTAADLPDLSTIYQPRNAVLTGLAATTQNAANLVTYTTGTNTFATFTMSPGARAGAALTAAADRMVYYTSSTAAALATITAQARTFMAATSQAAQRTALALGTAATSAATDFAPIGHVGSGGTAHAVATTSAAGFMAATDKVKLDGLAGTINQAIADHEAAANPHPQYMQAGDVAANSPVQSIFGRTGAVEAQNNDYTFAQIGSKPTTLAGYGITDAVAANGAGATGTWGISVSGSAATLTTARTIAISGIVTGTATTFNGSANISIPTTALNLAAAGITGQLPVARMGTGTANTTTFLRGDGTWATPTASAAWGSITGTLASQTDLNNALNARALLTGANFTGTVSVNNTALGFNYGPGGTRIFIRSETDAVGGNATIDAVNDSNSAFETLRMRGANIVFNGQQVWHAGNFNPATKANTAHTHAIGDVTGLQTALNGKANASNLGSADLNTVLDSGLYRFDVPSANGPGFAYGLLLVIRGGDTITQMAFDYGGAGLKWRSASGIGGAPSWGAWKDVWHSGNFDPSAKTDRFPAAIDNANTPQGFGGWVVLDTGSNTPTGSWANLINLGSNQTHWRSQIAQPFFQDEWYLRRQNEGVWQPWHRIWHSNNFNPASKLDARGTLNTFAATISNWNAALDNGWYMAAGATNSPPAEGGNWLIGIVSQHNGDWVTQEVWNFTGGTNPVRWKRQRSGGTWGGWEAVTRQSAFVGTPELEGHSTAFFADSAVGTQRGGFALRRTGGSGRRWDIGIEANDDFKIWSYTGSGAYQSNPISIQGSASGGSHSTVTVGRLIATGDGSGGGMTQALMASGLYGGGIGMKDGNAYFKMNMENQDAANIYFNAAPNGQGWTTRVGFLPNGIHSYSGWVRTYGNTGWYSESYGGGWYMTDTEWIRNFNSKRLVINAAGGASGTIRLESNDPTIACHDLDEGHVSWIHFNSNQHGFLASNSQYAWAAYRTGGNEWHCTGNIVGYASDERLKDFHGLVDYNVVDRFFNEIEIRNFDWNEDKMQKYGIGFEATKGEVGVSAQQMQKLFSKAVTVNGAHNPVPTVDNPNPEKHDILTVVWDKTIPLLIAEIQSLRARITKLESK